MSLSIVNARKLGTLYTDATVSSATTLTVEDGTDFILLETSTQPVRITFDGTTPTASVGFLLPKDTVHKIEVRFIDAIKIIETAASASVQWQCFQNIKDTDS